MVVHRTTALDPVDVTVVDAIPVTTVTRTLIDLAAVITPDVLEEALDDALRRGLTSIPRLQWRLAELGGRGRAGARAIRAAIAARAGGDAIPASVFETRLFRVLSRSRLPLPVRQHRIRVRGRVIAVPDFAYPDIRVAIEADGYGSHGGRARWAHDLARRNRVTAVGWRVIHVTWSDLRDRPDRVVATISAALGTPKG